MVGTFPVGPLSDPTMARLGMTLVLIAVAWPAHASPCLESWPVSVDGVPTNMRLSGGFFPEGGDRIDLTAAEFATLRRIVAGCTWGELCGRQRASFNALVGVEWIVCLIDPSTPKSSVREIRPPAWLGAPQVQRIVALSKATAMPPDQPSKLAIELTVDARDESPFYAEIKLRKIKADADWTKPLPTAVFDGKVGAGFPVPGPGGRYELALTLVDAHGNRSETRQLAFSAPAFACIAGDTVCFDAAQTLAGIFPGIRQAWRKARLPGRIWRVIGFVASLSLAR